MTRKATAKKSATKTKKAKPTGKMPNTNNKMRAGARKA